MQVIGEWNMIKLCEKLQTDAGKWRKEGYPTTTYPAIKELLLWNKNESGHLRYLREAQFLALELYWYVRIVLKTPKLAALYNSCFTKRKELLTALGIPIREARADGLFKRGYLFELLKNDMKIVKSLRLDSLYESLYLKYPSYILALAMGAGKTVLIGTIVATEFSLSMEYPRGNFMKNALVFAPGTTIIESLREISDIPFEKILPPRFCRLFLANVKMVYTRASEKSIPVQDNSLYNVIVTNTEKIALKKIPKRKNQRYIDYEEKREQEKLLTNTRLNQIASLPQLGIFSDEAHHTYGNRLGAELKRVRSTINHLHDETPVVCVVNTTGTPYYKKQPLKDVIFWYSLQQGIQDNILKSLQNGIITYDFSEENPAYVIHDIITDFFEKYGETTLSNGAPGKIAFYFKGQKHLEESKPLIEKALIQNNQSPTTILVNTQKSTQREIEEFHRLNDPLNQKRIILLVGKGTEGWNCPSLFATALIRELSSSNNFILQAATRCLRQVAGNKQRASIYIEAKNQKTLDKELQETFALDLSELNKLKEKSKKQKIVPGKVEYANSANTQWPTKIVRKGPLVEDIILIRPETMDEGMIVKTILGPEIQGSATLVSATGEERDIIISKDCYDVYTATLKIARNYHIDYLPLLKKVKNIYPENEMPRSHLKELFKQVEKQTGEYRIIWDKNRRT